MTRRARTLQESKYEYEMEPNCDHLAIGFGAGIDGRGLPSGRPWRLVAVPAAAMPSIELELVMPDADPPLRWRIALADGASAPVVLGAGAVPETQVIDLDAAGRAEQEW